MMMVLTLSVIVEPPLGRWGRLRRVLINTQPHWHKEG